MIFCIKSLQPPIRAKRESMDNATWCAINAIQNHDLDQLKKLINIGFVPDELTSQCAARWNNVAALEYLRSTGYLIVNSSLFKAAAERGSKESFQWMLDNGYKYNNIDDIYTAAYWEGQHEFSKWLTESKKCKT